MTSDLANVNEPVTHLFSDARSDDELRLTAEQIESYNENGYLSGIRILNDIQIEALRSGLAELMSREYASNPLFYEFHLNESTEPQNVLFHGDRRDRRRPHHFDSGSAVIDANLGLPLLLAP